MVSMGSNMREQYDAFHHISFQPSSTRVPVTNSILYAYSAMRGNSGKNRTNYGPLHDALFLDPIPLGYDFGRQIYLPNRQYQSNMDGPQRLFWDPSCPVWEQQDMPETLREYIDLKNPERHPSTLDGYTKEELLRLRPCRFTGKSSFANYGYILINGNWVDPDSQGAVSDALKNEKPSSQSPKPPISMKAPCLMSLEQTGVLYNELCNASPNASHEEIDLIGDFRGDFEPDPRLLRISPRTFARWAVGASQGDAYVRTEAEVVEETPSRRHLGGGIKPPRVDRQVQFDVETGSLLSGIYEPEREPSLAYSAQGVDPIKRPHNFARSYPMGDLALDRAAYNAEERMQRTQDWISSTVTSAPKVYNSEGACDEFASHGDPESGAIRYEEKAKSLTLLTEERENSFFLNDEKYIKANEAEIMNVQLQREIFFMKRKLENNKQPLAATPRPGAKASPLFSTQHRKAKRGQYQRFFDEQEEKERLIIHRTRMTNEKLDRDLEAIHAGMGELKRLHRQFLCLLNVKSVHEIEKLWPGGPGV